MSNNFIEQLRSLTKYLIDIGELLYTADYVDLYNAWASRHGYVSDMDTATHLLNYIANKQQMRTANARSFFLEGARVDGII